MTENNINLDQQIEICFGSPEGYAAFSSQILSGLGQSNDLSHQSLIDKLSIIITSKSHTPTQRFYALYFLLKATDHAQKPFFEKVAKAEDLLAFLFRSAQYQYFKKAIDERGISFFSSKPSTLEAIAGSNFVRLCIETLIHWQAVWGDKNSAKPCYIFNFYISTLKKKITLPTYFHFIGRNYALKKNLAIWNFADRLPSAEDLSSSKTEEHQEKLEKENTELIRTKENKEAKQIKQNKEVIAGNDDLDDEILDDINEENFHLNIHDEEEDLLFSKIRSNKRANTTTVITKLDPRFQRVHEGATEKDQEKKGEFQDGAMPKGDEASTNKEPTNKLVFDQDDTDLGELGFKKVISAPGRTPPPREEIITQDETPKSCNTDKRSQNSSSSSHTSDPVNKFKKAVNVAKHVVNTFEPIKGKCATNKIAMELLEIQNSIQKSKDRKLQGAFPTSAPEISQNPVLERTKSGLPSSAPELSNYPINRNIKSSTFFGTTTSSEASTPKEAQMTRKHSTVAQVGNQPQTIGSIWNDQLVGRPLTPLEILNSKNDLPVLKGCVRTVSHQETTSLGEIDEGIKPDTNKNDRFSNMIQGVFNQARVISNPGQSPMNNLSEQRAFQRKPSGLVKKDPFLKYSAEEMQNYNPQLQRGVSHIYECMPVREVGKDPTRVVQQASHRDFTNNNALPKKVISFISSPTSVWVDDEEEARRP